MAPGSPHLTIPTPRPEHRSTMIRLRPVLALALTLPALPAGAAPDAGAPAAAASGRTPEAILDDYAKAVGASTVSKHKNLHMKRRLSIKAMGMIGTEERWLAVGDKMLAVMSLPGLGTNQQGPTGGPHGTQDPINGTP